MLATLVAAVLGLHLVLLAGDLKLRLPDTSSVAGASAPNVHTTAAKTEAAHASTQRAQGTPPVHVSTVRWIVPTPTPAPRTEVAPRPTPVVKKMPAPRTVPAPPALMVQAPPEPEPIEITASAPAKTPVAVPDAAPDAAAAAAAVSEHAPEPEAPAVPPIETEVPAQADIPALADDTLVAAARAKPRAAPATAKLPPAQPPASTRLLYDVTGNVKGLGYKAQGALDWTVTDGRYEARMEMRVALLGSRSQTSTGLIGPNGLEPERFADKSRSEKAAHFDAAQRRIRFSNNAPEVPLQPGAQDRLSLFLQLAGLLQARPQAYTTGQTVDMQVAGTGDAPIWRFDVGEESTISLPAGEFKVRHLVRQPRKEFDSTVEMWLAPSLNHLPVRLRVKQSNGDVADQQLSKMP